MATSLKYCSYKELCGAVYWKFINPVAFNLIRHRVSTKVDKIIIIRNEIMFLSVSYEYDKMCSKSSSLLGYWSEGNFFNEGIQLYSHRPYEPTFLKAPVWWWPGKRSRNWWRRKSWWQNWQRNCCQSGKYCRQAMKGCATRKSEKSRVKYLMVWT